MKVIIVGAGFVGMQLARTLVAEGRDVVLLVQASPEGEMAVAHGGHVVQPGQRIVVVAPKGDNRVLRLFGDR